MYVPETTRKTVADLAERNGLARRRGRSISTQAR
jgi:hypothetical protein